MTFSDKALRNIIKENINNKTIVYYAAMLYNEWTNIERREKAETELTKLLLNKYYEDKSNKIPIPEKPVTRYGE